MKAYIGTKLIHAEPMTRGDYNEYRGWTIPENENPEDEGYFVLYSDDYVSWSPKDVFESAYFEVGEEDHGDSSQNVVSVTPEMVEAFISDAETYKIGDRTTIVRCILRNGFEIIESSTCIDPDMYSEEVGRNICIDKITDKTYELLGFLLQTAIHGVKKEDSVNEQSSEN
jgi:hypothetical protein